MKNENSERLMMLTCVVDRGRGKIIGQFYEEQGVFVNFLCYGRGTANSELLDLLGLGSSEKDVMISLMPQGVCRKMITSVSRMMSMASPGRGIAFTVPLSAVNALVGKAVNHEIKPEPETEREGEEELVKFCLILAVYNAGYTEEIVAAAKKAGAAGGTVLHARGVARDGGESFFGMPILEEKEVIAILASTEEGKGILEQINKDCGLKKEPQAIVLSLPVHQVAGLG